MLSTRVLSRSTRSSCEQPLPGGFRRFQNATDMNPVKIGDRVRLPGFPALLEVEEIAGALGTVCWKAAGGQTVRNEVFLSQLLPPRLASVHARGRCFRGAGSGASPLQLRAYFPVRRKA